MVVQSLPTKSPPPHEKADNFRYILVVLLTGIFHKEFTM